MERGRLRRITLPALDLLPAGGAGKESEPPIRIDIRGEAGPADEDCLGSLALFLLRVVTGRDAEERPAVELDGLGDFTRRALEAVAAIPRGGTACYAEIAARAGRPGAARAAGQALARNPVPLIIPCHRVVRSDGSIGGWSGAPGWKEWLLESELGNRGQAMTPALRIERGSRAPRSSV